MKRFITNILLFCIFGIFINYIAYIFMAKPILYNDYYPSVDKLNRYKCFLLSDSHGYAIQKKDLSRIGIYNFSFSSDSYIDMLFKLHFLINNARPATIFLSADDHTFSGYREKMNNVSRSIRFCNAELYKQFYREFYPIYIFKKYINPYFPLLNTNNSKLFYSFLTSSIKSNKLKTNAMSLFSDLSPAQRLAACQNRMKYQFSNYKNSGLLKKALAQIISICKKNNITLIGIKFPITRQYSKILGNKSYHADTFLKEHGIKIINLKNVFAGKDNLFSNQDHLNLMGSKKFVIQLSKQGIVKKISCMYR